MSVSQENNAGIHHRAGDVDLKQQGIILGKLKKKDVAEECRFAYKDIDAVMEQQKDLVTPVRKLKTVVVVKG